MKAIHFTALITILLLRSTSLAGDPKRNSVDADSNHNKSFNNSTLHVRPVTNPSLAKTVPTNLRNHGLTSIGGPHDKSKSTAAISGTEINR